jgi:hypothetical protein
LAAVLCRGIGDLQKVMKLRVENEVVVAKHHEMFAGFAQFSKSSPSVVSCLAFLLSSLQKPNEMSI